jgi:DNA-directed RNA polymerase subunit RPC12/RpoP
MGKRDVFVAYEVLPISAPALKGARFRRRATNLKCRDCRHEFVLQTEASFDTRIKCEACGKTSELRQLHEEWCRGRRSAFEELAP